VAAYVARLVYGLQVVFVQPVCSKEALAKAASKTRALQVNGRNIIRWARWLCNHPRPVIAGASASPPISPYMCTFDADAAAEFAGMNGVPSVLLLTAVYPDTEELAAKLMKSYMSDREGPASSRHGSKERDHAGLDYQQPTAAGGDVVAAPFDGGVDEFEVAVSSHLLGHCDACSWLL